MCSEHTTRCSEPCLPLLCPGDINQLSHVLHSPLMPDYLSAKSILLQTNHKQRQSAQGAVFRWSSPWSQLTLQKRGLFWFLFLPSPFATRHLCKSCVCVCVTFWRVWFSGQKAKCYISFPAMGCFKPGWRQQIRSILCVMQISMALALGRVCVWSF